VIGYALAALNARDIIAKSVLLLASMQTQCPHCQTFFHITDEQLQLADGQVRCGQCDDVFDATLIDTSQSELLIDELSISTLDDIQLDVVEISIPDLEPSELDVETLTVTTDEQDQEEAQEENVEVDVDVTDIKPIQPSLHLVDNSSKASDGSDQPAELSEIQISTLTINTSLQAANEQHSEHESPAAKEIPTLLEPHEGYDASQLYPELDAELTITHQTIPKRYILASLFLILVFMGQSIFLLRDRLAENGFRPLMQSLCASLNCELALPRAPQEIVLKNRDIRSHPNIKNALSVKATIDNQAGFPQAYPLLQIQFHDIEGRIIAGRDFLPREYLPSDINMKKGIAPNNPVNIALELIDPGKNAVSFLFIFK